MVLKTHRVFSAGMTLIVILWLAAFVTDVAGYNTRGIFTFLFWAVGVLLICFMLSTVFRSQGRAAQEGSSGTGSPAGPDIGNDGGGSGGGDGGGGKLILPL